MCAERFERHVARAQPEAVGRLRGELLDYARGLVSSDAVRDAVRLAVSEALTNVVVHAYFDRKPGEMVLEAWLDSDERHLVVRVCDRGRGMVPRTDSPGLGLGLSLMAQMADDLHVSDRPGTSGTLVQLRFSLARADRNRDLGSE